METVRALRQLAEDRDFGGVIAEVEAIIGPALRRYADHLDPPSDTDPGAKAIKDAVWGMIDLRRREVLVLDSPPLQRLRRVRQLGLGFLTYPTAGYSRFEHSLGALHQADRMVRAIAQRSGRLIRSGSEEKRSLEPEILSTLPMVRLAATLHDIGHLPLSHVSERYFTDAECRDSRLVRKVTRVREAVQRALDVKQPSLAECLSVALILTPSCSDFLLHGARYDEREVAGAAAAIVGRPPNARLAFVSQLITNVIDADKLDYMFRDGFVTGVPLAVDLERLLFKLKCLELPEAQMPDSLRALNESNDDALVLGIDLGGQRLAYDVTVARTMLFERVYLHHKTRGAERVAMQRLDELGLPPWALLRYGDELFSDLGDMAQPGLGSSTEMLRDRRLPRRAYAISFGFIAGAAVAAPGSEPELSPELSDAWRRLRTDLGHAGSRRRLEEKIRLTAQRMSVHLANVSSSSISEIWVDTEPGRGDVGTWDLWVETPDERLARAETYDARAAAYAHSPAHTFFVYVTGTGEAAEIAFIATELTMASRYGLVTGRLAVDHAKIRLSRIESLKRELEDALPGVYDAVGRLRPEPQFLRLEAGRDGVQSLAERFHHYSAQRKVRLDPERITAFLRQFPPALGEQMLAVLTEMHFLNRGDLGEDFAGFLAEGADATEIFVPMTRQPDKSAAHLPYFFGDQPTQLRVLYIEEALPREEPITFFDDQLLSGSQAKTTVQTWLGLEPDLPDEQDSLARKLSEDELANLRRRGVRFRFAYGHERGLGELQKVASEHSLGSDVLAHITEPRDKPLAESSPASQELIAFLAEVGEDLLRSTKGADNPEKWTAERCRAFALGYGDLQQLVSLFYNTPTGTVTALWKGGRFRGSPWLPLLPRRNEPGVTRIAVGP